MKQKVATTEAPAAVGPYSQAVVAGSTIYCAGQIPLDPATGELVAGDAAAQADRVLQNLAAVLKAAGSGMNDVVKTTVYLTDLSAFPAVNEVYARYFSEPFPARATVGVSSLPKGAAVEIDAVAIRGEA